MNQGRVTWGPWVDADRNVADVLKEINELRRSRSLPEYHPRTTDLRVLPRPPSHRLRWRVDL